MFLAMNETLVPVAYVQDQMFDPWTVPDSFTVYKFAPDYVKPLLHPHWQTQKAVHPLWSYFFALYYLIMGSMAITGNVMVLKIFSHFTALRTPANMLVINLAVCDLMLMLSLIPESVYCFFLGGPWQFGYMGCQIHAFCGAFFGYGQITTLTIISWDRYNVIVKGFSGKPLTYAKVSLLITFIWVWSFGWALSPLVGWGLYALDGMLGTCSFDSYTTTMNHKSYILASCFFQYGGPIIVIVGCYFFIVKAVFRHEQELREQAKKMNVTSLRSGNNEEQQAVSAEIRAAKVAVVNIMLWIFAWTPFTAIAMVGTWHDSSFVTPLMSELPIICAKTSALYNPIIYALSHPKYRECLKELYPWLCIVVDDRKSKRNPNGDNNSIGTVKTDTSSS